jgi:hypothetical protein
MGNLFYIISTGTHREYKKVNVKNAVIIRHL